MANIVFEKIKIHNFLSFGDAELDFRNKGYVLVSGTNKNPRDGAISNGSGKCFGLGTKVVMYNGTLKKVEDIKVNDIVMGHDNTPRIVLETHSGKGPLYRINNDDRFSYIVNEEHLLCLKQTCAKNRFKKEYLGQFKDEISIRDYLTTSTTYKRCMSQYYNGWQGVNERDTKLIEPYFLGVWLGDGTQKAPSVTTMDTEIIEYLQDYAKRIDHQIKIVSSKKTLAKKCSVVKRKNNKTMLLTNRLDYYGLRDEKHIPIEYLTASAEDRLQLLAGLIDSDGTNRKKASGYQFLMKDDKLAQDIVYLARSLGFKVTTNLRTVNFTFSGLKKSKEYRRIVIYGDISIVPVKLARKKKETLFPQKVGTRRFTIDKIEDGDYYGFQISGDGKMLLEDGTVVHNSSIWSAISWALTGETIQGLSTNICNINMLNEGCWVELTFKIMEDEYKITRYKDFGGKKGSNLKIFINKEDMSGDGVRKSEALLAQYIPDLTSSLIGSVIILGQGLPHRFTNNTPSGRKEVLEKLSKSDFMIEDIKSRISKRSNELAEVKRTLEDDLLTVTTEQKVFMSEKDKETNKLLAYAVIPNFDEEINNNEVKINKIEKEIEEIEKIILEITFEQESANSKLFQLSTKKSSELDTIRDVYNNKLLTIKNIISELESDKKHLLAEITKYDNLKDVCPTCGQKIPGVCKHDTTSLKLELETILKEQTTNQTQIDTLTKTYNADISTINTKYVNDEDEIKATLVSLKNKRTEQTSLLNSKTTEKSSLFSSVLQLKNNKSTFESDKKKIEDTIKGIDDTLISIDNKILYINKESETLNSHILAVDKMNTLVKRDFRGFLLTHVIDFINIKAKEYCSYVFETDEIEFKLDGNSIDISYCGKDYENLSGGEKQKVDLIIQFSIRDMLCQYLNFSSNILVLDEITDNLDSKGSEKIVNFISNKLTDIESVFIITHHTELLKGLFESEVHVEKDENGVSKIK